MTTFVYQASTLPIKTQATPSTRTLLMLGRHHRHGLALEARYDEHGLRLGIPCPSL
jgi:hypothetical protein